MEVLMSKLNPKTLTIAAVILIVLALLFMATPLLRISGVSGRAGFNRQFNGQTNPGGGNGFVNPGNGTPGQGFNNPGGGFQGQGNSTNPNRQFAGRTSLLRFGFLAGITGIIVYTIALLVSLAAALGMIFTKRWGQILGILMGAIYFILALFSFIPTILLGFARAINGLNLGLTIVHVVLALAVIVLALISARKVKLPAETVRPSATSA
jgi:hypothetical protein